MNTPFEMVGKLKAIKESEKFKPYEIKDFPSGWVSKKLKFNVISGDNRHMLTINSGSFKDGHGDVYVFSKSTIDSDGKKNKGESFTIPFKERLISDKLSEVAEFKKFIVDLEKPKRRYLLEKAWEKLKEGNTLTEDELKEMDIESENDVEKEFEKSKKRHHEFISEWDFVDFVKKVIESDKYKNKKFKIIGEVEFSYSENKNKVYRNLIPRRIYLSSDEIKPYSTATIDFYYNKDSLDAESIEEKGKYFINGYTFFYDRNRKKNLPTNITIALHNVDETADAKAKKAIKLYIDQFTVEDDSWKQLGIVVDMIDGAQKLEIDESMLTEFQQDLLLCGEITLDDIRKEIGGSVYGDNIQEYKFEKLAKGFSKGRQDTVYVDDDMVIKPLSKELPEGVEDLFDDDDDDL